MVIVALSIPEIQASDYIMLWLIFDRLLYFVMLAGLARETTHARDEFMRMRKYAQGSYDYCIVMDIVYNTRISSLAYYMFGESVNVL